MVTYFQAGNEDPHRHRTESGARRCAAQWLRENMQVLREEAEDQGISWREYRRKFLSLEHQGGGGGGVIVEIHDLRT